MNYKYIGMLFDYCSFINVWKYLLNILTSH